MSEGTHFTSEIRRRAVDAVLEGMTKTAVAGAYGVDRNTIARWVIKFEEHGDEALDRRTGSGRPRKLEDLLEEELLRIVLAGARSYDFEPIFGRLGVCVVSSPMSFTYRYPRTRFGDVCVMQD